MSAAHLNNFCLYCDGGLHIQYIIYLVYQTVVKIPNGANQKEGYIYIQKQVKLLIYSSSLRIKNSEWSTSECLESVLQVFFFIWFLESRLRTDSLHRKCWSTLYHWLWWCYNSQPTHPPITKWWSSVYYVLKGQLTPSCSGSSEDTGPSCPSCPVGREAMQHCIYTASVS